MALGTHTVQVKNDETIKWNTQTESGMLIKHRNMKLTRKQCKKMAKKSLYVCDICNVLFYLFVCCCCCSNSIDPNKSYFKVICARPHMYVYAFTVQWCVSLWKIQMQRVEQEVEVCRRTVAEGWSERENSISIFFLAANEKRPMKYYAFAQFLFHWMQLLHK